MYIVFGVHIFPLQVSSQACNTDTSDNKHNVMEKIGNGSYLHKVC